MGDDDKEMKTVDSFVFVGLNLDVVRKGTRGFQKKQLTVPNQIQADCFPESRDQ